jgi:hypothetical protein
MKAKKKAPNAHCAALMPRATVKALNGKICETTTRTEEIEMKAAPRLIRSIVPM